MTKFDIIRHPDPQSDQLVLLFARSDDGMIVGSVQDTIGRFGEDPNGALIRAFVDSDHAIQWVKGKCRELAGREDVDFYEKTAEKKIVLARMPLEQRRKM